MIDLKSIFPKGAKDFFSANAALSLPSVHTSDAVAVNVAPRRGKMNGVEAEFAVRLEAMKRAGEIIRYEYQGITLRWFDMRYTPDFIVAYHDPVLKWKFIEVKGPHIHYRQQALARFKGARGFWPEFTFELHQKTRDGWRQIL